VGSLTRAGRVARGRGSDGLSLGPAGEPGGPGPAARGPAAV